MQRTKLLSVLLVLVAMLFLIPSVAALSEVKDVEVNDVLVNDTDVVHAYRGETLDLDFIIWTDESLDNARVRAWLGGYKYDLIEVKSNVFDIEVFPVLDNGTVIGYVPVTKAFNLELELPEDMDASEYYTLHIDIVDGDTVDNFETVLQVEEEMDLLRIRDVIFSPGTDVEAGQPLFVTVRVENMGDTKEEDIKVTVSIPELGVSARDYIEELTAHEDDEEDIEDSGSANDIMLVIPRDAETGVYEINVDVEYDRGHELESTTETIGITGVEPTIEEVAAAKVTVDTQSKDIVQGESAVYTVSLANLGTGPQTFGLELDGNGVEARVDPASVTVQPDTVEEVYVYVSTDMEDTVGMHVFTLKVLSGDEVIKELSLGTEVKAAAQPTSDFEGAKRFLEIAFIALLIILVILGLVIAVKKLKGSEEEPEEPGAEGQTYY